MVLDAEKELGEAQSTIEAQKPIVSYHDKFVAERDDIITVELRIAVRIDRAEGCTLLKEQGIAVRRAIGSRWSDSAGRMVEEFEWRPRQARGPRNGSRFDPSTTRHGSITGRCARPCTSCSSAPMTWPRSSA